MSDIIVRARGEGDETVVRCLIGHLTADDVIREVVCAWKDEVVLTAYWGSGVAANPYLSFRFRGGTRGDPVAITCTDSQGRNLGTTVQIA